MAAAASVVGVCDPPEESPAPWSWDAPSKKWTPFNHGCQMAKFDPFLSLDCARVEGVGAQSKERKGSNFAA